MNSTHPSGAWVYANVAGNLWKMSQPATRTTIPAGGGFVEVDTWANADAAQSLTFPQVNLVSFQPTVSTLAGVQQAFLQNITVFSPDGVGVDRCVLGGTCIAAQEVLFQREVLTNSIAPMYFINCSLRGGGLVGTVSSDSFFFEGIFDNTNALTASTLTNITVDLDCILAGGNQIGLWGSGQPYTAFEGASSDLSLAYIETGTTIEATGGVGAFGNAVAHPIVWGPGILNAVGRVTYDTTQTAVATFLNTGGLKLNGGGTGHSVIAGSPDVLNGAIALSPTTLDAAAGAAGFGGNAFNLGGGSFQKLAA